MDDLLKWLVNRFICHKKLRFFLFLGYFFCLFLISLGALCTSPTHPRELTLIKGDVCSGAVIVYISCRGESKISGSLFQFVGPFLLIFFFLLFSSRVPAADQMVSGPAALRPAHSGADLRPPLDEGSGRITQVTGGACGQRHPPQDHRHRFFIKHKLEQGEPLREALIDFSFVGVGGGGQKKTNKTLWEKKGWG